MADSRLGLLPAKQSDAIVGLQQLGLSPFGIDPAGNNLRPRSKAIGTGRHSNLIRASPLGLDRQRARWSHRARRRVASIAASEDDAVAVCARRAHAL